MESGRVVVQDVEEGEISDSASVEEITEEDFNKQDGSESKPEGGTESRVWTMRDLYHYPGFRTGWYNLAWAQGLQNKPLNGVYVMDVDSKLSSSKEIERVVLDDSGDEAKEEGELEEGEIDLDSEPLPQCGSEARLSSIRDELGSVDLVNAEQSFEQVCSRIHGTLEGLQVGKEDGVVQMLFSALGVVNSVFSSITPDQKEEKKEALSRLLSSVMNCDPPLLSPGQLNEIELMIASVSSVDSSPSSRVIDEEKDTQTTEHVHDMETDSTPSNADSNGSERTSVKWPSVASVIHSKPITSPEVLTPEVPAFKGRGLLLPLLDLHKDHDEDSLPSPTRDAPSCLPVQKPLGVGDGIVKPGSTLAKAVTGAEDSRLCQYETDAFKAVSSYQQKFGRSSFLMNDRLPSPTPSGEESADEDDDTNKEISSSFSGGNIRTTATPVLRPSVVSAPIPANSSISQIPIPAKVANPSTSGSNTTMKALAKSRDPRLRFANSDSGSLDLNQKPLITVQNAPKIETGEVINSRKQRASDEPNVDGPASKRQRNAIENVGIVSDMKSVSGVGGWLEDNGITGPPQSVNKNQLTETAEADPRISLLTVNGLSSTNGLDVGKEQVPITSTVNSLPELLKDIAGNPEILLNILKGQQQRLAAVAQPKSDPSKDATHPPSANLIPGSAPLVSIPPLKASGALQAPAGSASVTSQVGPVRTQDDTAKIRMKPRDPRRVLHGHTLQKTGSLVNEPLKTTAAPIMGKDNLNDQKMQEGQADKKLTPSQSIVAPDIARQFTKNLRNIADIMSVSADPSPPIVSLNLSSQPAQVKPDRGAVKAVASNNEDQQGGTASTPESTVSGPSCGPNTWGDVEHLFKAYDDTQKLAIQRERERRLEEQKKMFESRKLSLVLDLDHTLLNSAKFVEVDLVHDEILRKKEEQDREKPQRHLYRLPHMGMWTKLRPGIWNFLDKASKLFELHLYTMGNKLYATEMAKVLDPKGTLFSGRVISKGDDEDPFDGDERVPKSKDLEGVMGMESSVVIVDDSVRVWPHNKLNLIVVERYTYFPCSRRQFGLPGPSLLEIDHDERPEEGTLASSLGVIERIHQNFFSHQSLDEADVRNILASEQQKILAGCRIVFSRVFPVSEVNPHLHPLWQTAQQFGAVCTPQIDDQVTHVVANSPGTDKVNWALANGRFAVHPGWVEASALLYRRANEQDFAIKPTQP